MMKIMPLAAINHMMKVMPLEQVELLHLDIKNQKHVYFLVYCFIDGEISPLTTPVTFFATCWVLYTNVYRREQIGLLEVPHEVDFMALMLCFRMLGTKSYQTDRNSLFWKVLGLVSTCVVLWFYAKEWILQDLDFVKGAGVWF